MKRKVFFLFVLALAATGLSAQQVRLFPLSSVKLNEGPFLHAQQLDLNYMLKLDADRLLAPFLKEAGLEPKAPYYGSWESSGIGGTMAGHYLSALSQMYAATQNPELKRRLDYMLLWLEKCQEKNGNGYVGGVPDGKALWTDVASGKMEVSNFYVNKRWVPWYNMHKLFAGLVDAWTFTGSEKARQIVIKLADWCNDEVSRLSDDQVQEMLRCEQGGMNEALADVSAMSGNPKYLQLARRFSDRRILDPLLHDKDSLTGLHANTQIPKVIGFMRIAELSKDRNWSNAARFFWQTVVQNRSVSIGGNSVKEHFNPVDDFTALTAMREGPETCNSYNMLKLSKHLFLDQPDGRLMDYYERTTYNHILSSQHPGHGGFVYLTPLRPQHYRVYSSAEHSFWCCVGTGLENHTKYGELIYAHTDKDLFINLFIPSELNWKERKLSLVQQTAFPFGERSSIRLQLASPASFTVHIRKPSWLTGEQMTLRLNNKEMRLKAGDNAYVSITRTWKNGDRIDLDLPMETVAEPLPDNSSWVSFVHGPVVLAAATTNKDQTGLIGLGARKAHIAMGPLYPVSDAPVIIAESKRFKPQLRKINPGELRFSAASYIDQEKYKNLELVPFFQVHDTRYMLYWPVSSRKDLEANRRKWLEQEQKWNPVETATIDEVTCGEQQPEIDHRFDGEGSANGMFKTRSWRSASSWFSYELRNPDKNARRLMVTYHGTEKDKAQDIYVNDTLLARVVMDGSKGDKFVDEVYQLPEALIAASDGKPLRVKFAARPGSTTARVFQIRLLR